MTDKPLSIILANETNIPQFQEIFEDTWKQVYSQYYSPELISSVLKNDNTFSAWLNSIDKGNIYYLAQVNDSLVGMSGLNDKEIVRVGILTNHAGKGYGASLMNYLFSEAKNNNQEFVWCDAATQAIPFYDRLGFSTIKSIVKNVYGNKMPMLTMVKPLYVGGLENE